ncbi:hypothetical protein [Nitriliruptor alkaliphilus]|uniref:hypothetical protein n=1 Tax=Nitriliruptor alkaliphilus TaxID=427918 RepID=UPI0006962AD5|nr:hypothetical protein [Nitriliruptor alkaliphilus]
MAWVAGEILIARQPIMTPDLGTVGWELLDLPPEGLVLEVLEDVTDPERLRPVLERRSCGQARISTPCSTVLAAEGDEVSKGTERFLLVAVIILLLERVLFYVMTVPALAY